MKIVNINTVLLKFKKLPITHTEYTFYYELILEYYQRLIWKLVLAKSPANLKQDVFNECVAKLPSIVKAWEPNKSPFISYLYIRLRGHIQTTVENFRLIPYPAAKLKFNKSTLSTPIFLPDTEFFFPKVYPTVEADMDFQTCVAEILKFKDGVLWYDFYIENLKLSQMEAIHKLPKANIVARIKKIHQPIRHKLKRILGG